MTNKDASGILKAEAISHLIPEVREALYMGASALEQEPCDDCISVRAVLDIVDSYSESRSNVEDVTQDIISDIMALPTVNPQPCEDAISRQAAIDAVNTGNLHPGIVEALQSILADLPPVTPQPCEDCISRQAVLEELPRRTMRNYFGEVVGDVVYIDDIKALPPVTPQPKMGKWLKTTLTQVGGGDFNRGFKCSCCDYVLAVDDFNYCPNCGAKMESEEQA